MSDSNEESLELIAVTSQRCGLLQDPVLRSRSSKKTVRQAKFNASSTFPESTYSRNAGGQSRIAAPTEFANSLYSARTQKRSLDSAIEGERRRCLRRTRASWIGDPQSSARTRHVQRRKSKVSTTFTRPTYFNAASVRWSKLPKGARVESARADRSAPRRRANHLERRRT